MTAKRYQAYSIRFTPDELDELRARAKRENRTISAIIRASLRGEPLQNRGETGTDVVSTVRFERTVGGPR